MAPPAKLMQNRRGGLTWFLSFGSRVARKAAADGGPRPPRSGCRSLILQHGAPFLFDHTALFPRHGRERRKLAGPCEGFARIDDHLRMRSSAQEPPFGRYARIERRTPRVPDDVDR